tara:strand:- start:680 stop:1144 length:465 start_codon:yes stop_codon:yes gene_type:complete
MRKLIFILSLLTSVFFFACEHDPADDNPPENYTDTTTIDTTTIDTTVIDTSVIDTTNPGDTTVILCDTSNVTYSGIVDSVLTQRCVSCHNNSNASGGVRLHNYSSVLTVVNNGKLLSSIKRDGNASPMPQNQPQLDSCVIVQIEKWINDGAPNN